MNIAILVFILLNFLMCIANLVFMMRLGVFLLQVAEQVKKVREDIGTLSDEELLARIYEEMQRKVAAERSNLIDVQPGMTYDPRFQA